MTQVMNISLERYIKEVPLFEGADHAEICVLLKEYDIRVFEPSEYICRQGEYDENCSLILDGSASVFVQQANSPTPKKIQLARGEIFGEIAAMSGTPRTADVVADTQAIILNISREKLFSILDRFPIVKERVDATYRSRALGTHLSRIPIFTGLPKPFLEQLKEKVSLLTFKAGEVIFRQGMEADAFYLIRYGFVKVTQTNRLGKDKIIAYLNEGNYFGEIALLGDEKRTATIEALNRVELIKIGKEDFNDILTLQPSMRSALEKVVKKRLERNVQVNSSTILSQAMLAAIEGGVIQSKSILIMDLTKCVGCDNCVKACAAMHNGRPLLIRRGIKFNDFILLPTSCRNCQDPICMSKCPTGAIRRDLTGEIYHQDHCIGCGNCARLCPHGNIVIIERGKSAGKEQKKGSFFWEIFRKAGLGDYRKNITAGNGSDTPSESDSMGERALPKGPVARNSPPINSSANAPAVTNPTKAVQSRRKAAKCDMCRDYEFMGCVYNCPTGAARRVDPTEFFASLRNFG